MFYILKYVIWSLCEHNIFYAHKFVRYEQIDGGNILIVNIDSLCMHAMCVYWVGVGIIAEFSFLASPL